MKRLLSIILVVSMLFGMVQVPVTANDGPGNSTERSDDADFGSGRPGNSTNPSDEASIPDYGPEDMSGGVFEDTNQGSSDVFEDSNEGSSTAEDSSNSDVFEDSNDGPADMSTEEDSNCRHERTRKSYHETKYEKYNSEKHSYKETYEIVCKDCGKVLSAEKTERGKETHRFRKGKCADCDYVIKNCKHEETVEKVTYWRNEEDERGNDKSFTLVDVVCKLCDEKITEKTYYGPIIAIPEDSWCDHDELNEIVEEEYYEPLDEKSHYKVQKCKVKCDNCGILLKEYKTEEKEEHSIANGKCTKCIYENKTTSAQGNKKDNKDTGKNQSNQNKNTGTSQKKETIDWIYIDAEQNKFAVDGDAVDWDSTPILDPNGNLQVPLRQLAELMGWDVTWDAEKKHAIVTNGETTKVFMEGFDVYQVKNGNDIYYENLQNKVSLENGVLYVDLDGILNETGYSYYVNGTSYHIKSVEEVINKVVSSNIYGNHEVVASKTIVDDVNSIVEVAKDEVLVSLIPTSEGWFYSVMVPAANQSLKGNYYEGDFMWEGLVGEIIVGELPIVGQIADVRDVIADFRNWEWSWMHALQTGMDLVGVIPIIGALKYTDELVSTARKTGKVLDAGSVTKTNKLLKQADNIGDVADVGKKALKRSSKYVQSAKDSVKNVNDLKAMTKHPEIFSSDAIEHTFLGNGTGGFHYNGLSISNGKILKIANSPDSSGVYKAFVEINGQKIEKAKTFFPDDWLPSEVIEVAEKAYFNGTMDMVRKQVHYETKSGVGVCLNLDKAGKIVSWFPEV